MKHALRPGKPREQRLPKSGQPTACLLSPEPFLCCCGSFVFLQEMQFMWATGKEGNWQNRSQWPFHWHLGQSFSGKLPPDLQNHGKGGICRVLTEQQSSAHWEGGQGQKGGQGTRNPGQSQTCSLLKVLERISLWKACKNPF